MYVDRVDWENLLVDFGSIVAISRPNTDQSV